MMEAVQNVQKFEKKVQSITKEELRFRFYVVHFNCIRRYWL